MSFALGLTGDQIALILSMWDKSGLLDDPEWDNVPLHCLLVALVSKTICQLVKLPYEQAQIAIVAGLLHDIKKQTERKRAGEIVATTGMDQSAAFAQAAQEQAAWMQEFGDQFTEEIRVAGLSGHTSLQYFMSEGRSLYEKIFHIADDLCGDKEIGRRRGDVVVPLETRLAQIRVYYDWMVTEHPPWLDGKSWIEAQEEVGRQILDELATIAGVGTGDDLNAMLVSLAKID